MTEGSDSAAVHGGTDATGLLRGGAAAGRWELDPSGSRAGFAVKHFWGAVTVRGSLGILAGHGTVGDDGTVTGQLILDAAALSTGNKQRDKHLRSADFFDTGRYPQVELAVTGAEPAAETGLACAGQLTAAGRTRPVEFTAQVTDLTADAAVLTAGISVDRTEFGMTWRPLGIASVTAHGTVTARFVRQ